jgi:hypothetical protein
METAERRISVILTLYGGVALAVLAPGVLALSEQHYASGVIFTVLGLIGVVDAGRRVLGYSYRVPNVVLAVMLVLTWVFVGYYAWNRYDVLALRSRVQSLEAQLGREKHDNVDLKVDKEDLAKAIQQDSEWHKLANDAVRQILATDYITQAATLDPNLPTARRALEDQEHKYEEWAKVNLPNNPGLGAQHLVDTAADDLKAVQQRVDAMKSELSARLQACVVPNR